MEISNIIMNVVYAGQGLKLAKQLVYAQILALLPKEETIKFQPIVVKLCKL